MEAYSPSQHQNRLEQQLEEVDQLIHNTPHHDASEEEISGPFEGPEKLLEIWWQDSADSVPLGKGLRRIQRNDWETMLDEVHCKVLSVIQGNGVDAYMLSESSMFVWPHKLILKTCGTTTLLLGLETIMQLARSVGFTKGAWRAFYSRKSFMFPELQKGPHRAWTEEMQVLDQFFPGNGYHVGPTNGDHWLLYIATPNDDVLGHVASIQDHTPVDHSLYPLPVPRVSPPDQSMEILMSELHPDAAQAFYFPDTPNANGVQRLDGHAAGKTLSDTLGVTSLFATSDPKSAVDAYLFQPCGYSANIVTQQDRYATIHVTPETGYSYASFETNISFGTGLEGDLRPTVKEVVSRVLGMFKPGRWSLTLFVSQEEGCLETTAQEALAILQQKGNNFAPGYRRRDKICYEFSDYDLLFSTFVRA